MSQYVEHSSGPADQAVALAGLALQVVSTDCR